MKKRREHRAEWLEPRQLLAGWSTVDTLPPSANTTDVWGMAADLQMRLDGVNGIKLATFSSRALSRTGQSVRARNVTGQHELYLVVTGGQADITSFGFTPVQPRHARQR